MNYSHGQTEKARLLHWQSRVSRRSEPNLATLFDIACLMHGEEWCDIFELFRSKQQPSNMSYRRHETSAANPDTYVDFRLLATIRLARQWCEC